VHDIRAAVVGTGFVGPIHVEALRQLGVEVAGLVGSSPERARTKADRLGIDRVYPDYETMLADDRVDVVHIASPNHLHFPMAADALRAGKHVVCEKPLATNSQESAALLRLAEAAGVVHAVNFNQRFYPLCIEARERVARGDLGDLYLVHGHYLQDWLLYSTDWNWRLEPEQGGRLRTVGDIGSHWLDLLTFITGQHAVAVYADLETVVPVRQRPEGPVDTFAGKGPGGRSSDEAVEITTEDYATLLVRWESGVKGVVTVSQVSAGRKNHLAFELNGSRGSLAWNAEQPNELWIGHRDAPNELLFKDPALLTAAARRFAAYPGGHQEGYGDTFKALYQAVYAHIRQPQGAVVDYPTFADGHEQMLIGEAVLASAQRGTWVNIVR
jgi:predicted dehydrogenase